jgi:hypothetical protein
MNALALRTWFDQFDWALTPAEYAAFTGAVPIEAQTVDGFVVQSDRSALAWLRRRKEVWSWAKIRRARRWACVLRVLPFIRMIAIGNALGYRNCRPASDIDLVIVTSPRRVWIVRLLVTAVLKLMRQRPGEHARDALCPSFFLTTEALNLESLQINRPHIVDGQQFSILNSQFSIPPDPYLMFWTTQLAVLYDQDGTYAAFWRANQRWVQEQMPAAQPRAMHPRIRIGPSSFMMWSMRWVGERIAGGSYGDAMERMAHRYQERRFPTDVRAMANRDTRVMCNDRMIKLHTNDRRAAYREEWQNACAAARI